MTPKKKDVIALELYSQISKQLNDPPVHPGELELVIFTAFDKWQEYLSAELSKMMDIWETEVPNDDSLYTLGLRRAIDVINGEDPILPASV
jgi:hypothetical protein